MNKYIITTCSTIDLNIEMLDKYNFNYINNIYYLDNEQIYDNLKDKDQAKVFYDNLAKGKIPKTGQINRERFIEFFKPFLEKGLDLFHLSFSSGLSGTYNSARLAVEILKEEYPDQNIILIDSLAASSGFGMLVVEALNKQKEGLTIFELESYINDIKLNLNHWFYSTDLTYYIKGGRVTKTQGFIGTTLNICPILNVNNEGKLIPRTKVIGKKRVIKRILEVISNNIKDGFNYDKSIYISNSDMLEDALIIKEELIKTYPNLKEVVINDVGPFIGSHTGPGTIAIFFFGDKREQ